jgi:AmpE protein
MIFLSLIVVLGIFYWLGSASVIQYDGWYKWLVTHLQQIPGLSRLPVLPLIVALVIPLIVLLFVFFVVNAIGKQWLLFVYVPVLLYSLGRGNFLAEVREYISLSTNGDLAAATQFLDKLRVRAAKKSIDTWQSLHAEALRVIAYRGFERTFAVLFWFFIAGPFGALLYRLSILYRDFSKDNLEAQAIANTWLWLLEMPVVRLMGITWALVGNFETSPLRQTMLDVDSPSDYLLGQSILGALGAKTDFLSSTMRGLSPKEKLAKEEEIESETQDVIEDLTGDVITTHAEPAYSFALVKSSIPLYIRSLLFWLCAVAFSTLVV